MADLKASAVKRIVKSKKVEFVKLWFVDILGQLKSITISQREVAGALADGLGFDGSSIEGFARIYESDLVAKPDPATFQILPWSKKQKPIGRMFCDIKNPDGTPYEADPRYILRRNLAAAKKMGFTYYVGPEPEYFYFKGESAPEVLDQGGYFDFLPEDEANDLRRESMVVMEKMGIPVECGHHEVAPSQHEIALRHGEALSMADNVITYKVVVKQVARSRGVYASFMPKPIFGVNGSGMHVHQSLFKGKRNAFFERKGQYHLSKTARFFIAGILKHAEGMCAVTNQWINSYRRLVPGYEAPVYISWGQKNRSALVRVPMYMPGKEKATRVEVRFPDPACNPYLAFAVMLAAGLDGVKKGYKLEPPVEKDVYGLTKEEKKKQGITELPGDLYGATLQMEKSALVRQALGENAFAKFIANRRIEWDNFRVQVTNYELKKYLPIL